MSIIISPLEPSDYPAIGNVQVLVYSPPAPPDEVLNGIFPAHLHPDPQTHAELLANHFRQAIPSSHTRYKACLSSDPTTPIGLAIWHGPIDRTESSGDPTPEEQAEEGRVNQLNQKNKNSMDEQLEAVTDLPFYMSMKEEYAKVRKGIVQPSGCYYLEHIFVHPGYQRRGVGKALLDFGLAIADKEGVPVYLESSPAGKSLYLSRGFEIKGTVEINGSNGYVARVPSLLRPARSND